MKQTRLYEFCSWSASAALFVWPVLALIMLISTLYDMSHWQILSVSVAGTLMFGLFITGTCALRYGCSRKLMRPSEIIQMRSVYKILTVPITLLYLVVLYVMYTHCL